MMKFTLAWLKEHLDTDAPLAAIVDKLTMIGLEVEHLEPRRGDPRRTEGDVSRARRDLGYRPETPLAEGLTRHVESLRNGRRDQVVGAW